MKTKLTGVTIRNLKPAKDGSRVNYFDTQHKSLCLRVGTRDKVWSYHYRFNGKLRSPALGKYAPGRVDHMDRAAAISAANLIDDQITQGVDPKHNSKPIKAKPTAKNPNTYSKRVDQFIKYYKTKKKAPKSKTIKETEAHLTGTHITSIKHSDVKKITRAQLVKLLEDMHETPIQANRLHASLSIFFRWCWDHEYVDVTPLLGLNKRFVEQPRKRYLTSDEIEKFWKGCKELSYPTGNIYLLALVTGQRPG
ncbi:MAG: hypothetical protein HKP41_14530, partial [Desulfobacterales bacterium]|nr:hypothetical protein [Desulfobacterales bacterium]